MINRTDAWKCSDGTCFDVGDKEKAYNHEIKTLMQGLPRLTNRPITALHLRKVMDETKKWLLLVREFNETLKKAPRDRGLAVVKEFKEVVAEVQTWLDSAKSLVEQMRDETDVETKRAMAGQGG